MTLWLGPSSNCEHELNAALPVKICVQTTHGNETLVDRGLLDAEGEGVETASRMLVGSYT